MLNEAVYNNPPKSPVKKGPIVLLILVGIVVLGIIFWLYNYSFIEINLNSSTGINGLSYQLTNQSSQGSIKGQAGGTTIKKLVSRASYEIYLQQGNRSYFTVVKTKGFLRNASVNATLLPERSRQFVGNNPGSCMNYINNVLVSYTCSGLYSSVQIHEPATPDQPTYGLKNPNIVTDGYTEGIIQTNEGTLALIQTPNSEEPGQHQYIYFIQNNLAVLRKVQLPGLQDTSSYSIAPYKTGFVVYDASYHNIFYYPTAESQPENVGTNQVVSTNLSPVSSNFQNSSFAVLYSSNEDAKPQSKLVVVNNNQSSQFDFHNNYSTVQLCGNGKVCLVGSKGLDVYDTSSGNAVLLFSLRGVISIDNTSKGLIAVRASQILNIDVENRDGFAEYSLGDYTYSGIQNTTNGYILSLVNNDGAKVALLIDQTVADSNGIDKKIEELQNMPEISTISIYGPYIFIVPNLGSVVYNNSTQSFGYDPATQQTVNTAINQRIDSLGINRTVFRIINTGQ